MSSLYEQDLARWAEQQGWLLRAAANHGRNEPIDWNNVAEEIETLGRSQAGEVASRLSVVIEHLLKLQFSPARDPQGGWSDTIDQQRDALAIVLEQSPSLRARLPDLLAREQPRAARRAARSLDRWSETEAARAVREHGGRYTLAEVLGAEMPGEPLGG